MEQKIRLVTVLMSVIVYGILIGVQFDPKVREVQAEAFGSTFMGMPIAWAVIVVETLLYLPIPCVFWHMVKIIVRANQDGRRFGMLYLMSAGRNHPDLLRSQKVCFLGLVYFIVVCGSWIVYAASKGV